MAESDDRVERVARALCEADGNENPDAEVTRHSEDAFCSKPRREGVGIGMTYHGPLWATYGKQAVSFIAAHEALTGKS